MIWRHHPLVIDSRKTFHAYQGRPGYPGHCSLVGIPGIRAPLFSMRSGHPSIAPHAYSFCILIDEIWRHGSNSHVLEGTTTGLGITSPDSPKSPKVTEHLQESRASRYQGSPKNLCCTWAFEDQIRSYNEERHFSSAEDESGGAARDAGRVTETLSLSA